MSFFKKYNGTMDKRLARLERVIWILIYGGLLSALIGLFMQRAADEEGQWLMIGGVGAAVLGLVLIIVRSRLGDGRDSAPVAPRDRQKR